MARLNVRTLWEGYSIDLTEEEKEDLLKTKAAFEEYRSVWKKLHNEVFDVNNIDESDRKLDAMRAYYWPDATSNQGMAVTLED